MEHRLFTESTKKLHSSSDVLKLLHHFQFDLNSTADANTYNSEQSRFVRQLPALSDVCVLGNQTLDQLTFVDERHKLLFKQSLCEHVQRCSFRFRCYNVQPFV